MTYETVSDFVRTWGMVYFVILFLVVLAYALWPRNAKKFRDAARIPLEED